MAGLIRLKKGEERRIRAGHPLIYSNEINTAETPLKSFIDGEPVIVEAHDKSFIGKGYINPHSLIAVRLLSRDENENIDHDFFVRKIKSALAIREHLFNRPYYRLIYSEGDNLSGLIIDRYNNDFVVQVNTAGMENKAELIVSALREIFPDLSSILFRNDSRMREKEGLEKEVKSAFGAPPEEITLEENQVAFIAPLQKGQKTGWFYDHRLNRARLQQYAINKRVLDVFSYVGAFGIQAAKAGAAHVDCIDASEKAAEYIKRNAELNGVENKVTAICDDAFDAMKKLLYENKSYDVIVIDPPAFVKKFKDRKQGLIAYQRINELALKLLSPDGILFSCSCSMHVSMDDMLEMLRRSAFRTHSSISILERGHQGPDHPLHIAMPETDYLKAVVVRKS